MLGVVPCTKVDSMGALAAAWTLDALVVAPSWEPKLHIPAVEVVAEESP